MKLLVRIEGEETEIEITREGDSVTADFGGRSYELEASRPEADVFLLRHENKVYEVYVAPPDETEQQLVTVRGQEFALAVSDPRSLRAASAQSGSSAGVAEIKTAMPGKVVRILVESGTQVKQGDGVIVVEAMKMQNEMEAPKDGTVTEIAVVEGETVEAGELLVKVE